MLIYVILIIFATVFAVLESHTDVIENGKKNYSIKKISFTILFILFLLVGVLRSDKLGVDLSSYKVYYYDFYKSKTLLQILAPKFDISYILLNWILAKLCDNFWVFCASCYAIEFILVSFVIYQKSKNIGLSYLIYIMTGLMFFDFNILRQAIACSICLLSLNALQERNLRKFSVIVLLASTFHSTALIFLFLYPLGSKKMLDVRIRMRIASFALVAILGRFLMPRIVGLYRVNDYSSNIVSGEGYNLLLYFIIFFIYIKFCSGFSQITDEDKQLFEPANITVYFQTLALSFSLFTRLNYYSLSILMILLPNMYDVIDNRWRKVLQIPLYLFLVGFFIMQISAESAPIPYLSIFS